MKRLLLSIFIAAAIVSSATPAYACDWALFLYDQWPTANATAVPTNTEIWLRAGGYGENTDQLPNMELLTADAEPVPISIRAGSDGHVGSNVWLIATPDVPLDPNSTYSVVFTGAWLPDDSAPASPFEFTTGNGPANAELPPLTIEANSLIRRADGFGIQLGCSAAAQVQHLEITHAPTSTPIWMTFTHERESHAALSDSETLQADFYWRSPNNCVDVEARSITGQTYTETLCPSLYCTADFVDDYLPRENEVCTDSDQPVDDANNDNNDNNNNNSSNKSSNNSNNDSNNNDSNNDNAPPTDDQNLGCTTTGRSGATWMGLLLGLLMLLRRR